MGRFSRWAAVSIVVSGSMIAVLQGAAPIAQVEAEPNGTAATATPLRLRGGSAIGAGAITPGGDLDFWSFTAAPGARVWILTDTGGTQISGATSRDTVIDLIAPDGTTVIENDDDDGIGNGGDGTIETGLASAIAGRTLTAGGTYFIRVQAFSPVGIVNPYRLLVALTTVSPTPEIEPDDTLVQSNPVAASSVGLWSGNISVAADVDFYSVFASAGETVFISADADPDRDGAGTDLVVEFIAPDGTLLLSIDSSITGDVDNPAAESANFKVLTEGTYFVKVRHFSATGTGSYHLMLARIGGVTIDDFDGDLKTDIGVYRRSTGDWFIRNSAGGVTTQTWGAPTLHDISVPADYDGDGKADIAVYRGNTGEWFILNSGGGGTVRAWGAPSLGDIPVPGDYDGDGKADIAVYRGNTGEWFILNSGGGGTVRAWGAPSLGDIPVPGDYDGDGKTDIAVYRGNTGEWFILNSGGGGTVQAWGAPSLGDIPVPGDYDGDGKADIAVYRNTTGEWFVLNSGGGVTVQPWGSSSFGDIPVPGDYDGDGKGDIAIYRRNTGDWIIRNSSGGSTIQAWGAPTLDDVPLSRPSALR
jgi:FG-GAP-like repeat/Bacterial pre-peptidase C-terminal domain